MAEIINSNDNDVCVDVFLSAGAVDLSDSISDDLIFDLDNFLLNRKLSLAGILNHSYIQRVYIFPLTPRSLCTKQGKIMIKHKKYSKSDWISFADQMVAKVNQSHFSFHPKLKMVPMPQGLRHHISDDGIHLTNQGKRMLFNLVFTNKKPFVFSIEDFPPLVRTQHCTTFNKSPLQAPDQTKQPTGRLTSQLTYDSK